MATLGHPSPFPILYRTGLSMPQQRDRVTLTVLGEQVWGGLHPPSCPWGILLIRASAGKGLGSGAMGSSDLERAMSLDWGAMRLVIPRPPPPFIESPVWMHWGAPGIAGVSPGV